MTNKTVAARPVKVVLGAMSFFILGGALTLAAVGRPRYELHVGQQGLVYRLDNRTGQFCTYIVGIKQRCTSESMTSKESPSDSNAAQSGSSRR